MLLAKIKTWDFMVAQYGLNKDLTINVPYGFVNDMEILLSESRIVQLTESTTYGGYNWYSPEDDYTYNVSEQMIECFVNPSTFKINIKDIK